MLNRELHKKGPLPLLVLVRLATLVPPPTTMRAFLVSLLEGNLAGLAVLMDSGVAVRTPEEPKELVSVLGEQVEGEDEVKQVQQMVKCGLGEVGDQVEDEETADGVLQSDFGSSTEWLISLEEVTQQAGLLGVIFLELAAVWLGLGL